MWAVTPGSSAWPCTGTSWNGIPRGFPIPGSVQGRVGSPWSVGGPWCGFPWEFHGCYPVLFPESQIFPPGAQPGPVPAPPGMEFCDFPWEFHTGAALSGAAIPCHSLNPGCFPPGAQPGPVPAPPGLEFPYHSLNPRCSPPGAQPGPVPAPPGAARGRFPAGSGGGRGGAEPAVLRHRRGADPAGAAGLPLPRLRVLRALGHHGPRLQGAPAALPPAALRPLPLRPRVLPLRDHVDPPAARRRRPAGVPGLPGLPRLRPAPGAPALEVLPGGGAAAPQGRPGGLRALPEPRDPRGRGGRDQPDPDPGLRHGEPGLPRQHRLAPEPPALQGQPGEGSGAAPRSRGGRGRIQEFLNPDYLNCRNS
ncbi:RNA 5'-monophosphate methyltransferase isoform X1 [Manacus candei]|uniref:RNA 5'-monophosphate methyltransferase isoform X1 n=1 Tax=Manacus candei TaxID=415023 RepID=UPI002225F526|nr:RNA 5'-monophosphate methyltransferase isoform X1 [Manacus candei]XP_051624837.1 RNA 5'-monophosphate methyltransferase isoform X1 [Manacus candei]